MGCYGQQHRALVESLNLSLTNALVIQSGGSTPVLNQSLFGVVHQAKLSTQIKHVLGAVHGIDGVLRNNIVDLNFQTSDWWTRASRTPGALLGSSRRKPSYKEIQRILHTFKKHGIEFCFIIGGNDSAETGHQIHLEAKKAGVSLTVMNVPKTIDNDLVLTDHTPGYGSAANFIALATMGAGRDAETMGKEAPITVIEVMGRDAGWLAAASIIGKKSTQDAPHVVCVPEVPVDSNRFIELMEGAYRRWGFAISVVAENTRGLHGPFGENQKPLHTDDFGHPYYQGGGYYLTEILRKHLDVRVRYEKPGTIQRSMASCISITDSQEAELVGRAAVDYAIQGISDHIVTLVRKPGAGYHISTEPVPLEKVAGKTRTMPPEYFDKDQYLPKEAFIDYVTPLIGENLPIYERLG